MPNGCQENSKETLRGYFFDRTLYKTHGIKHRRDRCLL